VRNPCKLKYVSNLKDNAISLCDCYKMKLAFEVVFHEKKMVLQTYNNVSCEDGKCFRKKKQLMQLRSKTDVTQHIKSINFTFEIHYQNIISSQHDSDTEILSLFANFFLVWKVAHLAPEHNSCAI
jgi:hypothetical protein